jgi:hypothetical protein
MNNEQQQIIDEVYKNYSIIAGVSTQVESLTKEEFINKCKTDNGFANTWGLKIEERELSREEKVDLYISKYDTIDGFNYNQYKHTIPTKQITITYNNETIEKYEYEGK